MTTASCAHATNYTPLPPSSFTTSHRLVRARDKLWEGGPPLGWVGSDFWNRCKNRLLHAFLQTVFSRIIVILCLSMILLVRRYDAFHSLNRLPYATRGLAGA